MHADTQCSTLPRFLTDRKTSRTALLSLRSFLSPLFLLCSCFCGSHCVHACGRMCGCVGWYVCVPARACEAWVSSSDLMRNSEGRGSVAGAGGCLPGAVVPRGRALESCAGKLHVLIRLLQEGALLSPGLDSTNSFMTRRRAAQRLSLSDWCLLLLGPLLVSVVIAFVVVVIVCLRACVCVCASVCVTRSRSACACAVHMRTIIGCMCVCARARILCECWY